MPPGISSSFTVETLTFPYWAVLDIGFGVQDQVFDCHLNLTSERNLILILICVLLYELSVILISNDRFTSIILGFFQFHS